MNLGLAYNLFMQQLEEDDWACFLDHDAMFTTDTWYKQLEEIIALPDTKLGLLTAITNRVGNDEQLIFTKDSPEAKNHDIYFHRKIGKDMHIAEGNSLRVARKIIGGVMMLISKKMWRQVGGFKEGFLGVDGDMDEKVRKAGYVTYIADGIYVYHWYRAAPEENGLKPYKYDKSTYLPPV
jgi:GT2 family glycosyltransferase